MKFTSTLIIILILSILHAGTFLYAQAEVEDRQARQFILGKKAFNDQFYDVAITQIENYLRKYPAGRYVDEAHILLGQSYFYKKNYTKALHEFRTALDSADSEEFNSLALYWDGEVNYESADYAEAVNINQM